MVIRCYPGSKVKLVHTTTNHTFEMDVESAKLKGTNKKSQVAIGFSYSTTEFVANVRRFEHMPDRSRALWLHYNSEIHLKHNSNESMRLFVNYLHQDFIELKFVDPRKFFTKLYIEPSEENS